MTQPSAGQAAAKQAYTTSAETAQRGFDIGLPALKNQLGQVQGGLEAGGEPEYVKEAYAGQRTGIIDLLSGADGTWRAPGAGGNMDLQVPADYGKRLARALMGSRVNESMAKLGETLDLLNTGMGGAGAAGSTAMTAGATSIDALRMMPQYNKTAANIFGIGAAGAGIYGALANAPTGGVVGGGGGMEGWG